MAVMADDFHQWSRIPCLSEITVITSEQGLTVLCETKRNSILRNGILRNGILRNGILRNGTLRNGILQNGTLRNGILRNGTLRNFLHFISLYVSSACCKKSERSGSV